MKNKKGVSFGRIILYVLFLALLVFFVCTLYLTFKSMKKEKITTNEQVNNSIRMVYNNEYDYSAADYIDRAYFTWSLGDSWADNDQNPFVYDSSFYGMKYFTTTGSYGTSDTYYANMYINDNQMQVGASFYDMFVLRSSFYPTSQNPNFNNIKSTFICYECDININLFKGYLSGDYYNRGSWNTIIWYVTDLDIDNLGNITAYHKLRFSSQSGFDLSNNLDISVINASKVKYFGFGFYQNLSSTDNAFILRPNYLPSLNSANNATLLLYQDLYVNFEVFNGNTSYRDGYNDGFVAGKNGVDEALAADNRSLQEQVDSLNSLVDSLNSRIDSQQIVINDLNSQINNNVNFKNLFFTMADVPFRTVSNALGFEFWGVNLFRFFVGIITPLGIVWLIKKIL